MKHSHPTHPSHPSHPSHLVCLSLAVITLLTAGTLPAAAQQNELPDSASLRPTVAVLDFDFAAAQQRGIVGQRAPRGNAPPPNIEAMNVGKGIADLLVAELVNRGDFRVLERQRMAEVGREQQGGNSTRARYLVMGAVTKFSGEQKTKGGSAGAVMGLVGLATHTRLGLVGPMMGALSVKENSATVELSSRIVDATTGEIVGTANGSGLARRQGLSAGGFGGGRGGFGGGSFKAENSDFQATILGEASVEAVKNVAATLGSILGRRQ